MEQKSLKRNYILNLIRTFCSLSFPLITFAYASKTLSVDGIGKVDFSKSVVSYFVLFASLGISTYGIREGAKIRNDRKKFSCLVKEIFTINLITTILAYIVFFMVLFTVPKFGAYKGLLLINSLSIGFTALGLEWLYGALEEYQYITIRYIVFQIISFVLLFSFVKTKEDYYAYAMIIVFSTVGSNIINFIHARKFIDFWNTGKLNLKRHIRPIFIFFANTLAGNVQLTLDTAMIGFLSTEYAVGLYSTSVKVNSVCVPVITSLSTVLLPRVSYYVQVGEMEKYKKLLKQSFECIMILALPISCGIFHLSDEVILLFSKADFLPASPCIKILSITIIALPVSMMIASQILIPFGKEQFHLYAIFTGALVNVVINAFLIPRFTYVGAAVGTAVAEALAAILNLIFAFKYFDYRFAFKDIWHYLAASAMMFVLIISIGFYTSGLFKCMLTGSLGAGSYFLILYLMKDEFFMTALEIVKGKLFVVVKHFR